MLIAEAFTVPKLKAKTAVSLMADRAQRHCGGGQADLDD